MNTEPKRLTWDEMPTACPAFASGRAIALRDGRAHIVTNGSKWAGQGPDPLLCLFGRLRRYRLDSRRVSVDCAPTWGGTEQPPEGAAHFGGNFEDFSGVFSIYTDSPRLKTRLAAALNQ